MSKSSDESVVKEFHEVFNHPIADKPTVGTAEMRILRAKLLLEEVLEFIEASGLLWIHNPDSPVLDIDIISEPTSEPDIVEMADALGDIRYVTDGANLVFGFPQNAILNEIHASNMSKLGEDGKPIYREDGKVMKGPKYFKPNIAKILGIDGE